VVISNPGGSAVSSAARLRVDAPPFVLIPPAEQIVRPNANVILSVLARGSATLRYQWRLNGLNLSNETNSFLIRNNVQLADDGEYDVLISNAVGTALATGRIVVLVNPVILVPPLSQSVPLNSRVTLSVTASGNPLPFTFEWRRGSVAIETHVVHSRSDYFTFIATNAAAAETYRAVVKNLANSVPGVPSVFATITILADADADGLPDLRHHHHSCGR
jgi:hypothetical protein